MNARRVLLHIGAPKSGTTYLQTRLHTNAANLAEHGVRWAPGAFRAAGDLTGVRLGRGAGFTDGWWDRLVAESAAHEGTVLISHESFVRCDDEQAARAVTELGPGVEVVYTARDLARSLVSGWLEGLKHGTDLTFAAYLDEARGGRLKPMRAFDVPTVLGRWSALAPTHLVTVPPPGGDRTLLWERFLQVCGIEPAWAPEDVARSNEAVGLPQAQVLRLLNSRLGERGRRRGGALHEVVGDLVVPPLSGRPSARVELDPAHHGWVAEEAARHREWVRGSNVQVTGDLADLTPAPPVDPWVDPDVLTPEAAEEATRALAGMVREVRRLRRS